MKKIILAVLCALFALPNFSQTITVLPPDREPVCIQRFMDIRWTVEGEMHDRVKIVLKNAQTNARVLSITDDTENDGHFRWNVPASVAPGMYKIKIRVGTTDNAFSNLGPAFSIARCTPGRRTDISHVGQLLRDLEFVGFSTHVEPGGHCELNALVKNNGNGEFSGNVLFGFNHDERSFSNPQFRSTQPVTIPRNQSRHVVIPLDLSDFNTFKGCGYWLDGKIDPLNVIAETDENNNTHGKKVYAGYKLLRLLNLVRVGKVNKNILISTPNTGTRQVTITPEHTESYNPRSYTAEVRLQFDVQNCSARSDFDFTFRFKQKGRTSRTPYGDIWRRNYTEEVGRFSFRGQIPPYGGRRTFSKVIRLDVYNQRECSVLISFEGVGIETIDLLTGEIRISFEGFTGQ